MLRRLDYIDMTADELMVFVRMIQCATISADEAEKLGALLADEVDYHLDIAEEPGDGADAMAQAMQSIALAFLHPDNHKAG